MGTHSTPRRNPYTYTPAHAQPRLYFQAWHEALYAQRFANLGNTATIVNLGDLPDAVSATTFTTRVFNASGSSQTATWATAPGSMATPYAQSENLAATGAGLYGPAGVPALKFDGTSDRLTIPDAAYWTRALAAFSVTVCAYVGASTSGTLIRKDNQLTTQEWYTYLSGSQVPDFVIYDQTASANIRLLANAGVSVGTHHLAFTYDGAANMNGSVIYVDGVSVAATASSSGVFVTMRDTAAVVSVGSDSAATPGTYFNSVMHGGPWGPTFVQAQLTAAQVLNDYRLFRGAMGLA